MDKNIVLAFKLMARNSQFKRKLDKSIEIVEEAISKSERGYIAFSGGKDSTVVLDLVKNREAIFTDESWRFPETDVFVSGMAKHRKIHWIRTNGHHTSWFETVGIDADYVEPYAKKIGIGDVCFLGLRKDENNHRRILLNKYGPLFYAESKKQWHCNPLADWTARDIWAYIFSRNLNYNKVYDKLCQLGIPIEKQRVGPLAESRALWTGQIAILKLGWPNLYQRFASKYPDARRYT